MDFGFTLNWGTATDRGHSRAVNEDALLAGPPVFLVADGMGGHRAGDVASAIVVDEFTGPPGGQVVTSEWIVQAFDRADGRIRSGRGGGTTVAGVALVHQRGSSYWLVFNIGDSRVYRFSDGTLTQVSVDHSVVQEMFDDGQISSGELREHPDRHVITRAVGLSEKVRPDYWLLPVNTGERLMICSDGLTSEVDEPDIALVVAQSPDAQSAADALVHLALDHGGRDNVTTVVVDVLAPDDTARDHGRSAAADLADAIDDATVPRGEPAGRGAVS